MDWVDELIGKLSGSIGGVLSVEVNGKKIETIIKEDMVLFFAQNKEILRRMGKQSFKDFLLLINEKKNDEAFAMMLNSMTPQDIIDMINDDADALAAWNENREKFVKALQDFVLKVLAPQSLRILIALLTV